MKLHLTATGCHLPYEITQCYLPQVNTPRLNPSQTGRYSINIIYIVSQEQMGAAAYAHGRHFVFVWLNCLILLNLVFITGRHVYKHCSAV